MSTLVIGGNSGIGKAFVDEDILVGQNSRIFRPGLAELDVNNDNTLEEWFSLARENDIIWYRVVYCAGVNHPAMIGDIDSQNLFETFDVNVMGFIRVLDYLKRFQNPIMYNCSILAVVSDAATVAMRGSIGYCASKAALSQAIRCAAREMAPYWRVNGVAPGVVEDTPMTAKLDKLIPAIRDWTPEHAREYEQSMIPMGRRGTPREVARVMLDVLDGPEYLTGAIIPITGGK